MFFDSKPAKICFWILWFITAITALVIPLSIDGAPIRHGGLCVVSSLSNLGNIPPITFALFDLTMYVSISYRIISYASLEGFREEFWTFSPGKISAQCQD